MPPPRPLSELYFAFVVFEVISINLVGFLGLLGQPALQRSARALALRQPERPAWEIDAVRGLFWTEADATTTDGFLLHLMIAGWLGIAGVLQALIHF